MGNAAVVHNPREAKNIEDQDSPDSSTTVNSNRKMNIPNSCASREFHPSDFMDQEFPADKADY